jgi:hypothetical protein
MLTHGRDCCIALLESCGLLDAAAVAATLIACRPVDIGGSSSSDSSSRSSSSDSRHTHCRCETSTG